MRAVFVDVYEPVLNVHDFGELTTLPKSGDLYVLGVPAHHPMDGNWRILSVEQVHVCNEPAKSYLRVNVERS